ncbi:acyl-CoA thioester hydrolase/BAAT C-terminal domain-containing protein [Thalassotalea sp. 1_MG-2023]|uniref:acyl-CoA thioester hydrolase/BAAT C-terminal domain-containing protein n=1 Tax=Thalassotalea sp. 1_MG-2023 TaxID=3062680 RepID=UPI0026E37CD5|nr:acyl-CoA thioester hydrolase/BAAT C-terminal domain-containing protein [Thalassotalea sp. 1_MG-2023]MDO6426851.1 acyl-CoA thioester hydrolase/BAAT C-terminal domain-containing protein [Thalassotalea sp. 1_MG-2023]
MMKMIGFSQVKVLLMFISGLLYAFVAIADSSASYLVSQIKQNGINALLYTPKLDKTIPAVIVLGGSSGRLNTEYSEILAANGIVVLSLAYFKAEGLPQTLDNVPVEIVSRGLDYLQSLPQVEVTQLGILGVSRGSELAFLSASVDNRVRAVAGIVPSSVSWHGQTGANAWSLQSKPVAALTFERRSPVPIFERAKLALDDQQAVKRAQFSFDNINGAVLLVSAKQDHIWPSHFMSKQIIAHLKLSGFKFPVQHIVVDDNHFLGETSKKSIEKSIVAHFSQLESH